MVPQLCWLFRVSTASHTSPCSSKSLIGCGLGALQGKSCGADACPQHGLGPGWLLGK